MVRRSRIVVAGLLVAVVALGVPLAVVLGTRSDQPLPKLVPQVRDTFISALVSWDTAGYGIPAAFAEGLAPAMPTSAQLEQQTAEGYAAADKYFSPVLAERLKAQIETGVAVQRDPNRRALGAGVKNLVIKSVTFDDSGSTATIRATYTHWANSADGNPDGSWSVYAPSNDVEATAEMVRNHSGNWVVTGFVADFINATGP